MSNQFMVPLIFTKTYIEYLNSVKDKIYSVYFPNYQLFPASARIENYKQNLDLLDSLDSSIKRKLLLNTKFIDYRFYNNTFKESVENFCNRYNIDSIIIADGYFINFFDNIKVEPSVNFKIDSIEKFNTFYGYLKNPSKEVMIDRDINLNKERLDRLLSYIHSRGLIPVVLVNEGCLPYCPFKDSHDLLISLRNYGNKVLQYNLAFNFENASKIHSNNSCISEYTNQPWRVLTSPFIRPEELDEFPDFVVFKIAKRTAGEFVKNIIEAYINKKYDKNLLDLLDSPSFLSMDYYIFNDMLPKDFYKKRSTCNKDCNNCLYCKNIFTDVTQKT